MDVSELLIGVGIGVGIGFYVLMVLTTIMLQDLEAPGHDPSCLDHGDAGSHIDPNKAMRVFVLAIFWPVFFLWAGLLKIRQGIKRNWND